MSRPEQSHRVDRLTTVAAAVGLLVLSFVTYGNTLAGEFVWDDASSILLHQHVKDPSRLLDLFSEDQHAFARGQGNFYRPLLSVTFMLDYALSRIGQPPVPPEMIPEDLSPTLFHVTSVLWHAAAGIALFAFLSRIGASAAVRFVVCALYIVHPLHTEAVAYISGRGDSMAAAFMFAALYFSTWDETPRRRIAGVSFAAVAFTAGLLSKESALILPLLLALAVVLGVQTSAGDTRAPSRWAAVGVGAALLPAYAALRSTVLSFGVGSEARASSLGQRVIETLQCLAIYLKLIVLPTGLHMERSLAGVPQSLALAGGAILILLVAAVALSLRSGRKRAAFGFAWFIVTWLPVSGLFPLNAPMAEHWMYVPLAGLLLGVAESVEAVFAQPLHRSLALRRAGATLLAVWFIALIGFSVVRNADWRSNEALYTATLRENPDSVRVQFNLGVAYQDLLDNPAGARRHFYNVISAYRQRKAADPSIAGRFWADELEAYLSLGELYRDAGRYQDAVPFYGAVLNVAPDGENAAVVARAAYGIGRCYLALGEYELASQTFRRAAALDPSLGARAQNDILREAPLAAFALSPDQASN